MKKLIFILALIIPVMAFSQSKLFNQVRINTDSTITRLNIEANALEGIGLINSQNSSGAGSALNFWKSRAGATCNDNDIAGYITWRFNNGTVNDTAGFILAKVYDVSERSVGISKNEYPQRRLAPLK